MLIEYEGKRPKIDKSAYIAPTAVICGDVTIGANTQVGFGSVISAEGGSITIGAQSASDGSSVEAKNADMKEITRSVIEALAKHRNDQILKEDECESF